MADYYGPKTGTLAGQDANNVTITGGTITGTTINENFTTSTNPASSVATTTAIVDAYNGVLITTNVNNTQTIANPTAATVKTFTVVNNDTSLSNINIIANSVEFVLTPGGGQCFLWDGSAWGPTDLGITSLPVPVTQGGTGLSTITDHGIMLGSGAGAVTPLGVATDGQIPIGSSGLDPVLAAITPGDGIDVTNAAGAITVAVDIKANGGLVIDTTELTVDLGASAITGTLAVGDGGTGAATAQAAINTLTAVTSATNEHVLTKDTATGNAIFKAAAGGTGTGDMLLGTAQTVTASKTFGDDLLILAGSTSGTIKLNAADEAGTTTVTFPATTGTVQIAGENVTVGAGKTLDVSAGTLTLAANQISGDSVEGGTIAAVTITTLTSTTVNGTTFDTNVAAAGVTLSGTTLSADGTDADINITVTPKGTGSVVISKVDINSGEITGITDLVVADGGTGASTLTDHGVLLGSGTGPITPMTALAAGEIIVGVGSADPHALAAGATTTIMVGGGAADPVWTTATGTGAPVRQTSPSLTGTLGFASATELTISGGAVTAAQVLHLIDTESDAASDDLVTINGGVDGLQLEIRAAHTDRTVVIKETGNILTGGSDIRLDGTNKYILFTYDGALSKWVVVGGSGGSGSGGSGHVIEDEGTPLASRSSLNFTGAGVTVTDDSENDVTVVTINTGGEGGLSVVEAQNTGHVLTIADDNGKTFTCDSTVSRTFDLPSVSAGDVGAELLFVKLGVGALVIHAADSDTIEDCGAGLTMYCTDEGIATVSIKLVTETKWVIKSAATGTWITTV